jgi:5-methylthioadenosine/S-adenosylhomocysteine deaminase
MTRRLIRNAHVVSVDAQRRVLPGGFVAVSDSRIEAVGPAAQMPDPSGFDEVIDARGGVLLPGLINMHQHHWYTLFKGLADGMILEDWVFGLMLPLAHRMDATALRVSGGIAAMEMLATGTTCSLNHSVTTTDEAMVAATIESQADIGIRQVFAKELRCRTDGNPNHPLSLDESLAAFSEEITRWHGARDGLVRMAMVIESAAHWTAAGMTTEALVMRGHELARAHDLRISDHISGGSFTHERGMLAFLRQTGRTDVRHLMQLGVLDRQWILIHGIHATELDLEHMALAGCGFVYTPSSESIRGGGIAPFALADRMGVEIALGTDGPMVDYSVDMLEQMKVCSLMQHVRHLDPMRMSAERTLEMATIDAARMLGMEAEIGSIEVGKRADLALFRLDRPHVGVVHRPLSSLLYAGKGSDAAMVMVDGRVVYRDGVFAALPDPAPLLAEATAIARDIVARAGLEARAQTDWRAVPDWRG